MTGLSLCFISSSSNSLRKLDCVCVCALAKMLSAKWQVHKVYALHVFSHVSVRCWYVVLVNETKIGKLGNAMAKMDNVIKKFWLKHMNKEKGQHTHTHTHHRQHNKNIRYEPTCDNNCYHFSEYAVCVYAECAAVPQQRAHRHQNNQCHIPVCAIPAGGIIALFNTIY